MNMKFTLNVPLLMNRLVLLYFTKSVLVAAIPRLNALHWIPILQLPADNCTPRIILDQDTLDADK